MKRDERYAHNIRQVSSMAEGSEMDCMVSVIAFQAKVRECSIEDNDFHIDGAVHFYNNATGKNFCTFPVPKYSKDPEMIPALLNWMCLVFDGIETVYDCGKWYINLSRINRAGNWRRVVHTPGGKSLQLELCRAAILAVIAPKDEVIEYKPVAISAPKKTTKKTIRKKKKVVKSKRKKK